MKQISISEVEGFGIGHATDEEAATGCSVIFSEQGAVSGVDVRGGAPGTRETDLLRPENLVERVHSIFLSGGSAYGLEVGTGVMQALEEDSIGFDVGVAKVPIVPGAILFDLTIGRADVRPDAAMGYEACRNAMKRIPFSSGNIGAGTGATVGKIKGPLYSMKGGMGQYAIQVGDLQIGAVIAVNSFGDVVDTESGALIAGVQDQGQFLNTEDLLIRQMHEEKTNRFGENTTIGAIVTNAKLTKSQATKMASIAHDGLARTVRPSHAFVDGDTLFCLSSGDIQVDLNSLASLAAMVVERAVVDALKSADSLHGITASRDLKR
ncbi:P1 family peptidase [Halobacillus salinus]|uniref:Peptidase S58 family protein n=1 Tax=Halobacillus salinus TaxID=192814 RepID=A0A4Z0H666_9BACI|nr:P1 family peptidase [Halobacillus salinus]TGB04605.1 peptidase S58 family protein [Halobacillus salinus]